MRHVEPWHCHRGRWGNLWKKDPKQLIGELLDRVCEAVSWICIPVMAYKGPIHHSPRLSHFQVMHLTTQYSGWDKREMRLFASLASSHTVGEGGHSLAHSQFPHRRNHRPRSSHLALNCATLWGVTWVKSNCLSYPLQYINSLFFFFFLI